jgi:NTE family protein
MRFLILFTLVLGLAAPGFAQSVGVVLSGGGASGMAHIGVLKALEEHNVPIDYITGTSMGGLIGGFYAAGYSIEEITEIVKSEKFIRSVNGELPDDDRYYYSSDPIDASVLRLKIAPERLLQNNIPTNVVTPDLMEYILLDLFAPAAARANYDFDSLMVPFRCVAADIIAKKQRVFERGSLPLALRATTAYPFYYRPVAIDSTLLFDGGLYNNFPADVMYDEFLPDVIIGSNVASKPEAPTEDDLVSLVRNMITYKSDFTIHCDYGVIIEPKSEIGVFDFSDIDYEIELGYQATIDRITEVKAITGPRERTKEELDNLRSEFKSTFPEKRIGDISISGALSPAQKLFVNSTFGPFEGDSVYTFSDFRPQYLRLAQDGKVRYVRPTVSYNKGSQLYDIDLKVREEKDLELFFGGNFSSRPVNMGYVAARYNFFGRPSVRANLDFGGLKRWRLIPKFVLNRWDYFRSFATFFELSRPSFIVKNETYGGVTYETSWMNNTVIRADFKYGETLDRYYQSEGFSATDTSDVTRFTMGTLGAGLDRNTLNRKVYATEGTRTQFSVRGIVGEEETVFGSTGERNTDFTENHAWIEFFGKYENYFASLGPINFGFMAEGLYSTKPFFENYTATVVSAPAFTPIPESMTLFLEDYHTTEYLGGGLKSVLEIRKNLEFRLEGYLFQPGRSIVSEGPENQPAFTDAFENRYYIGSTALVYHSPLGPVSLNLNYFDKRENNPWSFFFNFGYTLFNKSVYDL